MGECCRRSGCRWRLQVELQMAVAADDVADEVADLFQIEAGIMDCKNPVGRLVGLTVALFFCRDADVHESYGRSESGG